MDTPAALDVVVRPAPLEQSRYAWDYPPKPGRDALIKVRLQRDGKTVASLKVPRHILQRFAVRAQVIPSLGGDRPWVVFAHEARYGGKGGPDLETRVYFCRGALGERPAFVFTHYELLALQYPFVVLHRTEYPRDIDFAAELWRVGEPVRFRID